MFTSLVWLPIVRTDAVDGRCFIVACYLFTLGGAVSPGLVWLWLARSVHVVYFASLTSLHTSF